MDSIRVKNKEKGLRKPKNERPALPQAATKGIDFCTEIFLGTSDP